MFTSLGKTLLISNDLEACKLLNQQSLPLWSSLKFALFLCQVFQQASLKCSGDLQTHTRCPVLSGEMGSWYGAWTSYLVPYSALAFKGKERTSLHVSLPSQLLLWTLKPGSLLVPTSSWFSALHAMFAFVNRFNLSKIKNRRELLLAEHQF